MSSVLPRYYDTEGVLMERTSKEFKFNDVLDEIELYCYPCQYLGDSWQDEQLDFEIISCERNKNNHVVFSIKVSSSECNVNNISEQSIYAMCLKYFQWNSRSASTRTLIVTYNDDLTNFKGHRWYDTHSFEIMSVEPLYGNKWCVVICYEAEDILDTIEVAQAFDREFKCHVQVTMHLNHAQYQMIEDMLEQKGLSINVESFKE